MKTAFDFAIQGDTHPVVKWVNAGRADRFAAVNIAGDGEQVSAEVFVTTRKEAQQLIDAFTEARDGLPEEG